MRHVLLFGRHLHFSVYIFSKVQGFEVCVCSWVLCKYLYFKKVINMSYVEEISTRLNLELGFAFVQYHFIPQDGAVNYYNLYLTRQAIKITFLCIKAACQNITPPNMSEIKQQRTFQLHFNTTCKMLPVVVKVWLKYL